MPEVSPLGPIDPASVSESTEQEKNAPWIVRKLVGVSHVQYQDYSEPTICSR